MLYSPGACAQASAKVVECLSLCPELEHIAEARSSSSEFIAGNRKPADANPSWRSIAVALLPLEVI